MNLQVTSSIVFCFAISTIKVFQIATLLMKLLRMPLPGSWKPGTGTPNHSLIQLSAGTCALQAPGFQLPGKDTLL